jgi:hypothetical protein
MQILSLILRFFSDSEKFFQFFFFFGNIRNEEIWKSIKSEWMIKERWSEKSRSSVCISFDKKNCKNKKKKIEFNSAKNKTHHWFFCFFLWGFSFFEVPLFSTSSFDFSCFIFVSSAFSRPHQFWMKSMKMHVHFLSPSKVTHSSIPWIFETPTVVCWFFFFFFFF